MRHERRLLNAGMRDYRCGKMRRAEQACHQVLQDSPEHPDALRLLALVTAHNGNSQLAAALLSRAIKVHGPQTNLCLSLGHILRDRGELAASSICFRQALCADPKCADAHFQSGMNLTVEGRLEEATAAFLRTVDLDPNHAPAWCRMANILQSLGRTEESLAGYDVVLRIDAENGDALLQKARAYCQLDRMEEALPAYDAALRHWPELAEAYNEKGIVLRALGDHRASRAAYLRAIELDPRNTRARWNASLLDLLQGRFARGWEGYEFRFGESSPFPTSTPQWEGQPLEGQSILLHAEQGYGDTIQFIRYAAMVNERGGSVVLACRPELKTLMAQAAGVDAVVPPDVVPPGIFAQAALMSLPGIFRTTEDTIPRGVPYLGLDLELIGKWAACMESPVGIRRVGVAWAGSATHANDRNRSLAGDELAALASVPATTFFSLHPGTDQPPVPLRRLPMELGDFADTAAAIVNLDLVISVDTAVAHLAGALGRPVWTLLPAAPDWRWMLDRSDSPWYPTMRLFRQPARHQWGPVLEAVVRELELLVSSS